MKHSIHTKTDGLRGLVRKISPKNRILLTIVGGSAMIGAIMLATAPQHDPSVVEEKAWPVSTLTIQRQTLSPELQLFGKIETPDHAQVTAAVSATVERVNVVEGESVKSGDVLVILDDADELLRLQQRSADLMDAQSTLAQTIRKHEADRAILKHMQELFALTTAKAERLETLIQRNLVAAEQFEDTRQQVARQAIQLAQQQLTVDNHPQLLATAQASVHRSESLHAEQALRLQRTRIRAPFDGRISSVQAAVGGRTQVGQALVSVYKLANLRVRAAIPSAVLPVLKQAMAEGERVTARIVNTNQLIPLSLDQLAATVSPGRSGVDGLFTLDQSGSLLELGRAVDMTVTMPALQGVVAVPMQSLYGNNRVYTIVDGRLKGVDVAAVGQRVDQTGNFQTLVRSPDLSAGAQILTTTLPKASSGLKVEVIEDRELVGQTPAQNDESTHFTVGA